jgi:holo-[acyl-carrier protein] synthase
VATGAPHPVLAQMRRPPLIETRPGEHGVVASAFALVEIGEVAGLRESKGATTFSSGEEADAAARSDPERRLAARLAAKRAACALLGGEIELGDVEVVRGRYGPPALRLSERAGERLQELGARATRVSLTHERLHAAAVVLLLQEEP